MSMDPADPTVIRLTYVKLAERILEALDSIEYDLLALTMVAELGPSRDIPAEEVRQVTSDAREHIDHYTLELHRVRHALVG